MKILFYDIFFTDSPFISIKNYNTLANSKNLVLFISENGLENIISEEGEYFLIGEKNTEGVENYGGE